MRPLLWCALLLSSACATLQPLPPEAERLRAKTGDGWEISMVRYRAVGATTGRPVLLCHGIAANDRNMDLDDRHSMARWFAAHGRDAFTMSLRGTGGSDRASPKEGRADDSTFDEYWQQDLPAAIAAVRAATGAREIDYVGHSMGGMVAYAYLSQGGTGLKAVATMGSPTRLDLGTQTGSLLRSASSMLPSAHFSYPAALGAWLVAPWQGLVADDPVQLFFYNPKNTSTASWKALMAHGTADIAGGVALQLTPMMLTGDFKSADGKIDFRHDMASITTPVLVVAGRLDRTAPTPAVKDGFRALGGPKQWLLISEAHGAKAEYGHMDLVIGDRAGDEVWSKVLSFFDRY